MLCLKVLFIYYSQFTMAKLYKKKTYAKRRVSATSAGNRNSLNGFSYGTAKVARANFSKRDNYKVPGASNFRTSTNILNRGPWPLTFYTKLTYAEAYVSTQSSVGGITGNPLEYSLNSLFDPNISGGGHQPYGFDQLTPMYSAYRVIGCSIQITCDWTDANPRTQLVWKIRPSSNPAVFAGYMKQDFMERPMCGIIYHVPNANGERTVVDLGYFPINEVEGISKAEAMAQINYGSGVTTGPVLQPRVQLGCVSESGENSVYARFSIRLTYHSIFFLRSTVTPS